MKRLVLLAVAFITLLAPLRAAGPDEEQQLAILQSAASLQEKDAACALLKRIGTPRSGPALASLLADEQLSHSARYALESMPGLEAGRALIAALENTTGSTQAGIINSLGNRRETAALPMLAKWICCHDPQVASAAALALGDLGGKEAVQSLQTARANAPGEVQPAIADALLRCAGSLLAGRDKAAASEIYRQFLDAKEPHLRTAAWRGLILSAGRDASGLALKALAGNDRAGRIAALQLISAIPGKAATKAFAESLPSLPTDIQAAMIEALGRRGDAAAMPALVSATQAPSEPVRMAALRALGDIGDALAIPPLAEAAATATGHAQDVARESLDRIHGKGAAEAMLARLASATPAARTELILALGRRRETSAVPALLTLAESSDESQRTASFQSLALTADSTAVEKLIRLLTNAGDDTGRDVVEKTLIVVCSRSTRSEVCAAPVLKAAQTATGPLRCALLRVLGRINGAGPLQELRAACHDKDPAIQDAAIRSLADAGRPDAMADLLALANDASTLPHRVLALRGYWRAAALADKRPAAERLKMCEAGLAASKRPEEKKLGLIELANVPDIGAFKLVEPLLADTAIRAEAGLAIVQVARTTAAAHRNDAKAALSHLLATTPDAVVRDAAAALLNELEPAAGMITTWQVAGPYSEAGKTYRALFDIAFPPEKPGAQAVAWRDLPSGTQPDKPWLLDLLKFLGGEQRVAYVRAYVHSDTAQPARLNLGSDDGVKVWLNGTEVYANNTARPLKPESDKAAIALKQGWNILMLKITQNNMGWEFCARIVTPDGAPLSGLRFSAAPPQPPRASR